MIPKPAVERIVGGQCRQNKEIRVNWTVQEEDQMCSSSCTGGGSSSTVVLVWQYGTNGRGMTEDEGGFWVLREGVGSG